VGSIPFPRPPFLGVGSPRELAERMRLQPKQAVALLESGEVQRWFTANGWDYPVNGAPARSVAAVQQFFEGMGLSKAPVLSLSETDVQVTCVPPEIVRSQVILFTPSRKWVYAQVESDAPWLRPASSSISGAQRAEVPFEVDSTLADPGVHVGTLQLLANAGQRLAVQVRLEVERPHQPFTRRLLKPFFLGLLVGALYRLLLAAPADLFARLLAAPLGATPTPGSLVSWLQSPVFGGGSGLRLEFIRHFVLATWWLGGLGVAIMLWQRGSRWADLLSGLVAGSSAGLAVAATMACLLDAADGLPRLVLSRLAEVLQGGGGNRPTWWWTAVWLLVAVLCWGAAGGVAGFLLQFTGRIGNRLLTWAAQPLGWGFQACGLKRLSSIFLA
jgi:hypothetical protein